MNMNELTGHNPIINNNDEEVIVNPNIKKPSGTVKSVDPVQLRGLKTPEEIAMEQGGVTEFDEAKKLAAESADKEKERMETVKEVLEQTEGELDSEAAQAIFGFDPIAAMQNPPDPATLNKQKVMEQIQKEKGIIPQVDDSIPLEQPSRSIDPQLAVPEEEIDDEDAEIERDLDDGISASSRMVSYEPEVPTAPKIKQPEEAPQTVEPAKISSTLPEFDDEDDEDEDELVDEDQGPTDEERLEALRNEIHQKISPIAKKFDISTFSITKKPARLKNTLPVAQAAVGNKLAEWPLYHSGKVITMEGLLGSEIDTLASRVSRNNIQGLREQYNILYQHDKTPGKPETLEQWLKSISILDIDHLYGAIYRATFENANFFPYDCENDRCRHSFLSDSIPFMNMVKFANDNVKKRFHEILEGGITTSDSTFAAEVVPISDTYALSIRVPSIYDAVIRPAYLDKDFYARNDAIVALATYVDEMFYIDMEHQELRPIETVYYHDNIGKTERARIIALKKIVKTLTSDQYNLIVEYINSVNEGDSKTGVDYIVPETQCPKCGQKIEEQTVTASYLFFLRHRLATLANG